MVESGLDSEKWDFFRFFFSFFRSDSFHLVFFFRFHFFMTRRFADADAPNVTKQTTIICSICNPFFSLQHTICITYLTISNLV
jgi:hypothetical protein